MADVLSQSEVESLLSSLDPSSEQAPAAESTSGPSDELHSQVSVYDFKRPERVSKGQIRAFHALHEGFSREFGAALSGMLRTILEVKLISVDQLTYSEFVFSLETPTCFNLLRAEGLNGHVILDYSPSIIFPILDRLLGGGKGSGKNFPSRELTEIEMRLASRITGLAIECLENAWKNVCDLKLSVAEIESNPQLVQIVPPNEVIVLISFETIMGEARGIMNLCIPFNTIEPLSSKLSSDAWSAYSESVSNPRQELNLETGIGKAAVEMVVELAESMLSTRDVLNLAVGDVIMTEREQNEGLTVFVEGKPMFSGFPGLYRGHKAVRIGEPITRLEDVVEKRLKER
jgi:flagellar motor switch protein FliM